VPDPDAAISVAQLSKSFGAFTAVDAVTFSVVRGEIFGFLGPNGAGKTTTIKMLTGLLDPTSGEGRVAGHDIRTERRALRTRIGYMSQRFSLYPDLTVDENIRLFAGLYGVGGERFVRRRAWILEMADLEGAAGRLTGDLPLGWKQRLALGCALLHEPPILFLDEPTSGVDPVARRRFWDLIDDLAAGGVTVLVSTHYMEEAEYCHRLALISGGRLVAVDTPAGLKARLDTPLLQVSVGDAPAAVEAVRGVPGVRDASMFGRRLHVAVDDAERGARAVTEALRAAGVELHGIAPVEPSLEDVFVALVQRQEARVAKPGGRPRPARRRGP
jgi:ABC-2 type transport system ATP-binding protein